MTETTDSNFSMSLSSSQPLTSPDTLSPSQEFRLTEVRKLKQKMKQEIEAQSKLYRKYHKADRILSAVNTCLFTFSLIACAGSLGLVGTVVGAPIALALESTALGSEVVAIGISFCSSFLQTKAKKHERIWTLAVSKLNSMHDLICKALDDNNINDLEYKIIQNEYNKYIEMKNVIRQTIKRPANDEQMRKEVLEKVQELIANKNLGRLS